jgi:uncharacterized protein (TIGR03437 family)
MLEQVECQRTRRNEEYPDPDWPVRQAVADFISLAQPALARPLHSDCRIHRVTFRRKTVYLSPAQAKNRLYYHVPEMIRFAAAPSAFLSWLLLALIPGRAQVNVLTGNYNLARTNANLNETLLNTSNVNATQFGKLFSLSVNGFINAQPLYVANVSIPGKGTHNVVYVATLHNDVYAFDADAAGASLWHVNLGPSVPAAGYSVDDLVEIGILSTPVIDASTSTIYLVANTKENGNAIFRLHALDLATGDEKFGAPAVISATVPGKAWWDGQNGQVQLVPSHHLQRAGLVLLNNTVYIGFGAHGDIVPYHGWFLGYNAANVQEQVIAFSSTPNGGAGGIWHAGRAPAVDANGNIYLTTGNGSWDTGDWGETFLKLDTSNGLNVADWFTPDHWAHLNDLDNDLGSCGPVLTASGMVIGGGKEGVLYMLDRNNMGHLQSGNGQIVQSFQAIGFGIFNMAYWEKSDGPIVYLRPANGSVKAFRMVNGRFQTAPSSQASFVAGLPFDGMALSANGSFSYSSILWVTMTTTGVHDGPGVLHAFAATDLSRELWNSGMNPADSLGTLAKYVAPTVANGKVYVPTFSNQVLVYGLRFQKAIVGAVVNAASGLTGPVAPGEMVVVYGSGLGPSALAGPVLTNSGRLSNNVAGTQILFNGIAAPLIYVRADQLAAIVPNAVANLSKTSTQPQVNVQAVFNGQRGAGTFLGVVDTKPGLFTLDDSGRGPGAILNQDASVNSAANPAARGSIVVLYGTGQGLTNPDLPEDELASSPYPEPVNPVTVTIGGQTAKILYAGAAPGLAGLMQINAQVPPGVKPGNDVPVVVKIGNNTSQAGVTLAVQ